MAGAALVFLLQVYVRLWTPEHGITRFLRAGRVFDDRAIAAFRSTPKFLDAYPAHSMGFDGQLYAQLALDPLLRDPQLAHALDDPNYRAQRILLPWLAWLLGLGRPFWVLNAFAALNLAFWIGYAVLAARLFRPHGWPGLAGYAAALVTCGALESMQASLTDLPSFTLTLAALLAGGTAGAGLLALAALARGTSLLGLVGLAEARPAFRDLLRRNLVLGFIAAAPLALWVLFVFWRFRGHAVGFDGGNLDLPLRGMAGKLGELSVTAWHGSIRWHRWFFELYKSYQLHALLTIVAVLTQGLYLLLHRDWRNPLWRWGAAVVATFSCISFLSWESHFTVTRHGLPLALVFNLLLATRPTKAWPLWFLLGNCFVPFGVRYFDRLPDQVSPPAPAEFLVVTASGSSAAPVALAYGDGWFPQQWTPAATWRWARGGSASLVVRNSAATVRRAELRFLLTTADARPLRLAAGPREILHLSLPPGRHVLRSLPVELPPGETRLRFETPPDLQPTDEFTPGPGTFKLEQVRLILAP